MTGQKLYIKNMVCSRCIMVVQQELDKLGLKTNSVTLGEAVLVKEPTAEEKKQLEAALVRLGFLKWKAPPLKNILSHKKLKK